MRFRPLAGLVLVPVAGMIGCIPSPEGVAVPEFKVITASFRDENAACNARTVDTGAVELEKSRHHVLLIQSVNGCKTKDAELEVTSSSGFIRCNGQSQTGVTLDVVTPPGQRDFVVCSVLYGDYDSLKASFTIRTRRVEPRVSELALEVEP